MIPLLRGSRLGFFRLAYGLHVGEILGAPGGELSCYKILAGDNVRLQPRRIIYDTFNAALPSPIELNTGDLSKNIDGDRLAAHVEKRSALREVRKVNPSSGAPNCVNAA